MAELSLRPKHYSFTGFTLMKHLFVWQIWKMIYPYLVIARISILVLCSLVFLQADQLIRNLAKSSKTLEEDRLHYANRIHRARNS